MPAALGDLRAIGVFIGQDNPAAAERQIEIVFASVAQLARFPESGRLGRWLGTRELMIPRTPYIVPYQLRGDAVLLLRVLHGRQRWPDRV